MTPIEQTGFTSDNSNTRTEPSPKAPKRTKLPDAEGQALLRRLTEGDSQALNLLTSAYSPMIFGIFLKWFKLSLEDAEDLHQEVFLQMFIKAETITNIRSWLLGTAINQARKRVRGLIRDRNLSEAYSREVKPPGPPDTGDARDLVSRVFSKARPSDRELLHLIYFEGLDYRETAMHLGRPIGSIGPLRGRALARCADIAKGLAEPPARLSQSLGSTAPCPAH